MSKSRLANALDGLNRTSGEDDSLVAIDNVETEIRNLHLGIQNKIAGAMKNAIEIGSHLSKKKGELPHGQFSEWVEKSNLGFEIRQAQKYMRAYENKDRILAVSNTNSEFAFGNLEKALSAVKTETPAKPKPKKKKSSVKLSVNEKQMSIKLIFDDAEAYAKISKALNAILEKNNIKITDGNNV